MTSEQIQIQSSILARAVVLSLKDEKAVADWLVSNRRYNPPGDRVVSEALEKIRRILRAKDFDLKQYKAQHKRSQSLKN